MTVYVRLRVCLLSVTLTFGSAKSLLTVYGRTDFLRSHTELICIARTVAAELGEEGGGGIPLTL